MKFLHTSDWHLGARLGDFSRLEEQKAVLAEIRKIASDEEVDFVIIAGDLFDTFNPPNEAVELLYRELKLLAADGTRPVIAIAGNHDSPDRIEAPDPLAAECGIFFIGYPDYVRNPTELNGGIRIDFPEKGLLALNLPGKPPVRIITTPYANEYRLRKYLAATEREDSTAELLSAVWHSLAGRFCDPEGVNILAAHLFMTADASAGEPSGMPGSGSGSGLCEPEEEKSILHPGGLEMIALSRVPDAVQYTALGHLHRFSAVTDPEADKENPSVFYSGSPLAFGLSEEDQQKSVLIADIMPGGVPAVKTVPLESGRRIYRRRFSSADEAVAWLNDNPGCYVEILLECDEFLSGEERSRISAAHDGITAIIPVRRAGKGGEEKSAEDNLPDLSASLEELFRSYFEYSKGIPPDNDIMEIFREITAEEAAPDET